MKYGQVALLAHLVCQMQQRHRVDLSLAAYIGGNSFGPDKGRLLHELLGKSLTGFMPCLCTELISDLTQRAPLLVDVGQSRLLGLRGGDS